MGTNEPLFSCEDCWEECSKPANEFAVYKSKIFCEDCWLERRYFDETLPLFSDLEEFIPEHQKEIQNLNKKINDLVAWLDTFEWENDIITVHNVRKKLL